MAVAEPGPAGEGDEDVAAACHFGADAVLFEVVFKAQGGVQGEVFLVDELAGCAAVVAAVAGVDDDVAEVLCGRAGAEGGDAEEECQEGGVFAGNGHFWVGGMGLGGRGLVWFAGWWPVYL